MLKKMKTAGIFAIGLYVITLGLHGCNSHPVKKNERYYQTILCKELGGEMEHVLFDKTRVDCLTDDYAIEVDWANKWAEGIGQSLYYASITGKKPSVALIVGDQDGRYVKRINVVAEELNIKIIILEK